MSETIAFLDFETTGLSAANGDRPTEVAVVITRSRQIVDRFESLINPEREIPDFIVRMNGITNAMARKAPSSETVMRQLYGKISNLPVIAHNASFDRKFLQTELRRIGKRHRNDMCCSMRIARRVYRDAPNHKLGTLVDHAGLTFSGRVHRAMPDAEVTAKLWVEMEKRLQRDFGLAKVPFELMLQLQTVRIATSADFIRNYAQRAGLTMASPRRLARRDTIASGVNQAERSSISRRVSVTTSWAQVQCKTCEGKGMIQSKYVRRWLRCPDCRDNVQVQTSERIRFVEDIPDDVDTGIQRAAEKSRAADVLPGLSDLLEYSPESVSPFLHYLAGAALDLPTIEFELETGSDRCGPEPELAWPELKIAVLADNQIEDVGAFETQGWKVFSHPIAIEEIADEIRLRSFEASNEE